MRGYDPEKKKYDPDLIWASPGSVAGDRPWGSTFVFGDDARVVGGKTFLFRKLVRLLQNRITVKIRRSILFKLEAEIIQTAVQGHSHLHGT